MPSRIAKGFSLCTAIIGILCLVTGVGISICAWVLNTKLPSTFYYVQDGDTVRIAVGKYWWGGIIYILPGILGILAGCTRNVIAMVLYLIFNLICCICSLVVVVLCGLVLLAWIVIDNSLQGGRCISAIITCICDIPDGGTLVLYGGDCQVFMNIQVIVGAMVSMAALSSILSFIASYVSCCSLCNQDSSDPGTIIITGGPGIYQPPPVIVGASTNPPMGGGYQTGGLYQPPAYTQQVGYNSPFGPPPTFNAPGKTDAFVTPYSTSDKTNLVKNEYRP